MTEGVSIAAAARSGRRRDLARLAALMEDSRPRAALLRDAALAHLESGELRAAPILGVTGTPGSGKSTLVAAVTREALRLDTGLRIAVVAVDPSSPTSRGALLGDRTRMSQANTDDRIFFRSQASATALGGLAPSTYLLCRALRRLVDAVIVETVGIGQSETDIRHLADQVYLVMAPAGGDDVQLLKAGVMEIPDSFIVNKSDQPGASLTYHQLRAGLWLARPFDAERIRIFQSSALSGIGIPAIAEAWLDGWSHDGPDAPGSSWEAAEPHFFGSWVRDEWGRQGAAFLRAQGGADAMLGAARGFGAAQLDFTDAFLAHLR